MSHVHTPHPESDNLDMFTQEFWDARYRSADRIWSGNPNQHLVAQVAELISGMALDVGSGEGADAIWLAARGWQVTAIDVSTVALERAAEQAAAAGRQLADRITWLRADVQSCDSNEGLAASSAKSLITSSALPAENAAYWWSKIARVSMPRSTVRYGSFVQRYRRLGSTTSETPHRSRTDEDVPSCSTASICVARPIDAWAASASRK